MNESEERFAINECEEAYVEAMPIPLDATNLEVWTKAWHAARASIAAKQSAEPVDYQIRPKAMEHESAWSGWIRCPNTLDYAEAMATKLYEGRILFVRPPSPTGVEAPSLREALNKYDASNERREDAIEFIKAARAALAYPTAGEARPGLALSGLAAGVIPMSLASPGRDAPDREALAKRLRNVWCQGFPAHQNAEESWLTVADAAITALTGDSKP